MGFERQPSEFKVDILLNSHIYFPCLLFVIQMSRIIMPHYFIFVFLDVLLFLQHVQLFVVCYSSCHITYLWLMEHLLMGDYCTRYDSLCLRCSAAKKKFEECFDGYHEINGTCDICPGNKNTGASENWKGTYINIPPKCTDRNTWTDGFHPAQSVHKDSRSLMVVVWLLLINKWVHQQDQWFIGLFNAVVALVAIILFTF